MDSSASADEFLEESTASIEDDASMEVDSGSDAEDVEEDEKNAEAGIVEMRVG